MNGYGSWARFFLKWLGYLVALGACAAVANRAGEWLASAAAGGRRADPGSVPLPVVPVPEALDFKEALETDAFSWPLTFQNVSDRPTVLRGVPSDLPSQRGTYSGPSPVNGSSAPSRTSSRWSCVRPVSQAPWCSASSRKGS